MLPMIGSLRIASLFIFSWKWNLGIALQAARPEGPSFFISSLTSFWSLKKVIQIQLMNEITKIAEFKQISHRIKVSPRQMTGVIPASMANVRREMLLSIASRFSMVKREFIMLKEDESVAVSFNCCQLQES